MYLSVIYATYSQTTAVITLTYISFKMSVDTFSQYGNVSNIYSKS